MFCISLLFIQVKNRRKIGSKCNISFYAMIQHVSLQMMVVLIEGFVIECVASLQISSYNYERLRLLVFSSINSHCSQISAYTYDGPLASDTGFPRMALCAREGHFYCFKTSYSAFLLHFTFSTMLIFIYCLSSVKALFSVSLIFSLIIVYHCCFLRLFPIFSKHSRFVFEIL